MWISSVTQTVEGTLRKLRGKARIETAESLIEADEIDYEEETGEAEARGNVHFRHFSGNEELWADRVEYNVVEETGRFYALRGTTPAKIDPRPGVLTTTNPFVFQGRWAERFKDRYILYEGFITNCRLPKPIWTLRAPRFDIIPNDRALAYKAWFRVRRFPLLYAPVFYKSLQEQPRKSGFLTPNLGNSSRRGKMIGAGYYWAINRSYDAAYRSQLFTQRGLAHTVDLRGKPHRNSEFNFYLYGVNDRGLLLPDGTRRKEGGYLLSGDGKADLPLGFKALGAANYLSSFTFRQAFTETFNEAIFSEVQSIGNVSRHWSSYGLNVVFSRKENFQSPLEGDKISIGNCRRWSFTAVTGGYRNVCCPFGYLWNRRQDFCGAISPCSNARLCAACGRRAKNHDGGSLERFQRDSVLFGSGDLRGVQFRCRATGHCGAECAPPRPRAGRGHRNAFPCQGLTCPRLAWNEDEARDRAQSGLALRQRDRRFQKPHPL